MATYDDIAAAYTAAGDDWFQAAVDEPWVFKTYLTEHLQGAYEHHGTGVWLCTTGPLGALLWAQVGIGGYWYREQTPERWYESAWFGDPQDLGNNGVVDF